ncbi:transglutaminase-like domain-containing protein [Ruminococcus sp.]|uniref:transglutaminase-like domain-containing protein n=1 Tax=Ruminococcus sp. TaxID=41978 RepID=UPI0025E61D75|nr:transglutaminase-like domain-containing protein [Ruminococcus sp.]
MKETNNKKFSLKAFLLRTLLDPVLWYNVLIMMALMYHYRNRDKSDTFGYFSSLGWGLLSFVIGWVLFRIFDFMQKHHILGFLVYSISGIFSLWVFRAVLETGEDKYPISWGLWFLTPQDSLDYSKWYTLGLYILFIMFMSSVVYYFTRVRYRIFMNFLIFIIPFAIYGKEYEKMPTVYIVFLAVGYILLMVYYRQLRDDEKTLFVDRRKAWKPIAVYAAAFAVISALIPKPAVEADRTVIETLINAESLTDRLDAMINVFRDTSSAELFRRNNSQYAVYEADAMESLRIKTAVRSTYDYETDRWSAEVTDTGIDIETDGAPVNIGSPMGLADAFLEAARLDEDYADKYGLGQYVKAGLSEPEVRNVSFYMINWDANMAPVPQFAISLKYCSRDTGMYCFHGGTVYAKGGEFREGDKFIFDYSANTFFFNQRNKAFVDHLAGYNYRKLLEDTDRVLGENYYNYSGDEDFERLYSYFKRDYQYYDQFIDLELDYGDNERIKTLADALTDGIDSDYDKALVLESYFYNNDYVYDLDYRKKKGENAEDFLFETKTGVCYEYATSMVLLARAAGIPARYCEGYNMTRLEGGQIHPDTNFVVVEADAHGFPELYIKGYGWISFEPTITDINYAKKGKTATDMLSMAGLIMLIGFCVAVLFAMAYPWISHKLFILRSRKRMPNDTVTAVVHRICKVYDIDEANTSHEVSSFVHESSGADISYTADLFDRSVYGGEKINTNEKEKALNEYIRAYEAFRESRKRRRITDR